MGVKTGYCNRSSTSLSETRQVQVLCTLIHPLEFCVYRPELSAQCSGLRTPIIACRYRDRHLQMSMEPVHIWCRSHLDCASINAMRLLCLGYDASPPPKKIFEPHESNLCQDESWLGLLSISVDLYGSSSFQPLPELSLLL